MISIICACNNKKIFENNLEKTLKKQTYQNFEIILVDTISNKFTGAADALNYGTKKAKGEYYFFVHQDVLFEDKKELETMIKYIKEIKDFAIIGVAGKIDYNPAIGNISDGIPRGYPKNKIDGPTEVQTVDEVLFVISKEHYKKNPLSLDNKSWHLYSVEYCLDSLSRGDKVYIIPSNIYHLSAGASMNNSYYVELKRYCHKNKKFKIIFTTIRDWPTNPILLRYKVLKCRVGIFINKNKVGKIFIKINNFIHKKIHNIKN